MFKSNKITQSIEVVGPRGQDFRIETYKLFGDYFLEIKQVCGDKIDYVKTQRMASKEELFRTRDTCYSYLKDKGIW